MSISNKAVDRLLLEIGSLKKNVSFRRLELIKKLSCSKPYISSLINYSKSNGYIEEKNHYLFLTNKGIERAQYLFELKQEKMQLLQNGVDEQLASEIATELVLNEDETCTK